MSENNEKTVNLTYSQTQELYSDKTLLSVLAQGKNFRNFVWHVALPKSGTTWLSSILRSIYSSRNIVTSQLVPDYAERPQEIDPRLFITPKTNDVFFRQQHCLYSRFTKTLVEVTGTKIVFQYRNIEDALASQVDHLDDALFGSKAEKHAMVKGAHSLNRDELRDYVIDVELPWYCKFLSGWLTSDLASSHYFHKINYDALKESPSDAILHLSNSLDLGFSEREVLAAISISSQGFTRKNKGVSGRGHEVFTGAQKDKILRCMGYFSLGSEVSKLV